MQIATFYLLLPKRWIKTAIFTIFALNKQLWEPGCETKSTHQVEFPT